MYIYEHKILDQQEVTTRNALPHILPTTSENVAGARNTPSQRQLF